MSIYEIAEMTGVSATTVSRVINNDHRISNETILKVRTAMAKSGYRPAPKGQRPGRKPKSQKVRNTRIALYSETWLTEQISNSVNSVLSAKNCELIILYKETLKEVTDRMHLDGIIIIGEPKKFLSSGNIGRMPVVSIMSHERITGIDLVTCDNLKVGEIAADYLRDRGCKRVCAYMTENNMTAEIRSSSFIGRAKELGIKADVLFLPTSIALSFDASDELRSMIRVKDRPEGFFVFNDLIASSLYAKLLKEGMKLESDYKMISCDNNYLSNISPMPASIDIHISEIAVTGAKLILERISNPDSNPRSIVFDPILVPGNEKGQS